MKKIYLFLVLLLVLGTVGAFAQDGVSFGGNIDYFMTADEDDTDAASNIGMARVNMSAPVGEFNSAQLDMRTDAFDNTTAEGNPTFKINQFYISTDVAGALGIDGVGINTRFGKFEEWMSHWNAPTSSHRARNKAIENWAYATIGGAPNQGSAAVDIAIPDAVTLKGYVEFADAAAGDEVVNGFKLGAETSMVPNLNVIASYTGFVGAADRSGYLKADAGYDVALEGMSLNIPMGVKYEMEEEITGYYIGAKYGYDMFGVNLGLGGENGSDVDGEALDVLDVELMVSPNEIATLYAKMYTDPLADSDANEELLKSVDLGAKAAVGSMNFYAGYVVAVEDGFDTNVLDDDSGDRAGVNGSGFYMGARLSF